MEMLEGRADTREKIGRLEEALEDGNRMLSVEKTNPRVRTPDTRLTSGIYLLGSFT